MEWEIKISEARKKFYRRQSTFAKIILALSIYSISVVFIYFRIGLYLYLPIWIIIFLLFVYFLYFNYVIDKYFNLKTLKYLFEDNKIYVIKNEIKKLLYELDYVGGIHNTFYEASNEVGNHGHILFSLFKNEFKEKNYSFIYLSCVKKITFKKPIIFLEVPLNLKKDIVLYIKKRIKYPDKNPTYKSFMLKRNKSNRKH